LRFNIIPLVGALMLFGALGVNGQSFDHRHTEKKVFPVGRESTLELENKYGTILVVPWEKDSVQVTADLLLEAKSQAKLRKLRNDIDISYSATKYYIIVQSIFGNDNSRIMSEIRALSNTLGNKSTVEINYTVYVPDYIDLVLDNKYGDIFIDDVYGNIDISLANGALKANHIFGNATISLSFANGMIRQLGNSTINLSYAELDLGVVDQLDLISKSSELYADTIGVIKIDSRRDNLEIGQVEYLYGTTSFSDIRITEFIRESDCYMKYGKLTIDNVLPDFSRINLDSDFTDIALYFHPECAYDVDILHGEKTMLNTPRNNAALKTGSAGEEVFSTEGYIGNASNNSRLNIKALNKCYINISTR